MNPEPDQAQPQQLERHGYLFGEKITASLSPQFHKVIFDKLQWPWEQRRLDSADIPHFLTLLQDPKCFGASITMPNKLAIMEHLDEITEECREVGACNTIYIHDTAGRRRLCGANTDVVGIRESFYRNIDNPDAVFHDRPAMVIGGGGAARSAVYALRKWMRATTIYLVNRDKSEIDAMIREGREKGYGDLLLHVATVEQAEDLEAPGAIVACVPDFSPRTAEEVTARAVVEVFLAKERTGAVLEMCYNPTPYTELWGLASRAGWRVMLGTESMIWQGFEQSKLWTGIALEDMPVAKCREMVAAKMVEMG